MLLSRSLPGVTQRRTPRRGAVVVLAAISIIVLIGMVALSIDGGLLQDRRRHVQGAADAAAMSAAADMYKRWMTDGTAQQGRDPTGYAGNTARAVAAANGYTNDGVISTVTVNIPPASGAFVPRPLDTPPYDPQGYVEVIITFNETRRFSGIWGDGNLPVTARAVARAGYERIGDGVICLDLNERGALNAHGGGLCTITGGAPVIVNSNDPFCAITNGSVGCGMYVEGGYNLTGTEPGYTETGGSAFTGGEITTGNPPTPDPLAYLPPPDPASLPDGTSTFIPMPGGVKIYTLTPGVFRGGLSFGSKDTVFMNPGIYYMDQGGFSFSGQGSLTGIGVMIYNKPRGQNQRIDITGQGAVTLSPPTTGAYTGILIFQDRTADVSVNVTGNGLMDITGTFYAASSAVSIVGNGDVSIGSQYISRTLDIGGNGALVIDYTRFTPPSRRKLQLVE